MISTHSRFSCSRNSRQGFSLIEVAIALVIFVIGALAIIRIFPGALSVIGNNGDQQIATNLNRTTLARLQSENAVPYSTFNVAVNTNGTLSWSTADNTNHTADFLNGGGSNPSGDIDASVIGIPRFNASLPTPEDINTGANNSALSRFRGIQGEPIDRIRSFKEGLVNVPYILTQFPLSIEKINNGTTDTIVAPTVSQEYIVQNARIDKLGKVNFKTATVVNVNGDTVPLDTDPSVVAQNAIPANSTIYVSYRYYNANGTWGVSDEALPVPAAFTKLTDETLTVTPPNTTRGALATYATATPNTTGTAAEIVDVRVKRFIMVGEFGPLGSPAPATTGYPTIEQIGDARRGMVRIDTTNILPNAQILVDYVADWSWLLQKGVPSIASASSTIAGDKQIALGAPFVEDQASVAMYSLLVDFAPTNTTDFPNAFRSRFGSTNPAPAPADKLIIPGNPEQLEDELRAGKATFNVTDKVVGARVAFRTRSNWVQQLAVAANTYKPYSLRPLTPSTSIVTEPWRDYYLGDDNFLYFHAGEAGKTISVSYLTTDANGPLVNRPFVIETQLANAPSGFYNGLASRVKLTDKDGNRLPDNSTGAPNLVSIQAVKGVSVTARTAYVNGTKYAQTLLTSNRGSK